MFGLTFYLDFYNFFFELFKASSLFDATSNLSLSFSL